MDWRDRTGVKTAGLSYKALRAGDHLSAALREIKKCSVKSRLMDRQNRTGVKTTGLVCEALRAGDHLWVEPAGMPKYIKNSCEFVEIRG